MSTTLSAHGGGAQPARIDSSGKVTGGAAMRVYGFASEAEAQAAGFVCEGGPAMSVAIITDAQLASGAWKLDGDPFAVVIYTAPDSLPTEGGFAVPVYPVNGWGSAPAPSGPQFSSAEIGTVNASTIAVTFDQDVSAADYSDGVTIKINGAATSITSATRQSNHAIVYYVIPVLWHGSGDTVTWEYVSGSGNIVAESGGAALGDVTAQSVTNNCEYAALLDLQADTLALNDGDPVSTWPDQSGQGHDFTQTGSARPAKQTYAGQPVIHFDGIDDWMLGDDWSDLDNMGSFSVIWASSRTGNTQDNFMTKINNEQCQNPGSTGWVSYSSIGILYQSTQDYIKQTSTSILGISIETIEVVSRSEIHCYLNGVQGDTQPNGGFVGGNGVTNYSNHEPVRIGMDGASPPGNCDSFTIMDINSISIYSPIPSATNRAALEARLAARYGVTL